MTDNDDVFREDDQAPLLEHLRKVNPALFEEKSPDGKPLMSHSFRMIDMSELGGLRYPTQQEIVADQMNRYEAWEKKYIYPNVKIDLYKYPKSKVLVMCTELRLKHRGKYYLTSCSKTWEIDLAVEGMSLLEFTSHFHAEVYRYLRFMKVDLKLVYPGHFEPPKRVFELDPDQTPEDERIMPKY